MEAISASSAVITQVQTTSSNVLKDTLCGLISGMAGKYVEYPFDTVKVRLQTDSGVGSGTSTSIQAKIGADQTVTRTKFATRRYNNAWDCLVKTIKEEGVRGIYRGVFAPVVGAAAEIAVLFVIYNRTVDVMYDRFPSSRISRSQSVVKAVTLPFVALGGLLAGIFVAIMLTPIELVKCRLQVQELGLTSTKYKGVIDCAMQVIRQEGLKQGLFRGFTSTLIRDGPGTAVWFLAYEFACRSLIPPGGSRDDLKPLAVMGAGGFAGVTYWTTLFPADVIKSHQQTSSNPMGFLPTAKMVLHNQGFRGLYRGWGVTALRAAPGNATLFGVYELSRRFFDRYMGP